MDVDAAGKQILPRRVDHPIGRHRQRRADGRDLLAVDEDVALVLIGRGDDRAVLDEERHVELLRHRPVRVRPAIAVELPHAADFFDHVEVHVGDDELVLVFRSRRQEVAARVDKVGSPVEAADVPRRFGADAVAARHEVAVRDGVRRLLELPQVLRQAGDGRRRIEDDLGAVQPEHPRAFGKVPVVADVDADVREARLEHRIAEIAGLEEVLLPEARRVRDVVLAVLAQIRAVRIVDRRRVVVHAGLLALVHRHDHRHLVLLRELRHQLRRRPGHRFGDVVPVRVLRRTEVRAVEDLLEAEDLDAAAAGFLDERHVRVNRGLSNLLDRRGRIGDRRRRLNQSTNDMSRHGSLSERCPIIC